MPNSKSGGDGRGQVKDPENDGRLKENKGSSSSKGSGRGSSARGSSSRGR